MIDPRIYRAALLPVVFAFVLLAFSLENRPSALTTTLAPDAFEGDRAFERAYVGEASLASRFAERRPGSLGDERFADLIAAQMREAGFRVRTVVRDGDTIDGTRALRTIIAERAGTIDERIVVVAHRDAAGRRAEAELSGSAALLELARVFGAPRQTQRSLTLVSTSGGSGGAAGAATLADELRGRPVGAVLVLGDLASRNVRPPLVTPWSNALGATPHRLRATLQEALRIETGSRTGQPRALSQFERFALPGTFGEQGALLAGGLPAMLLSIGGDRPVPSGAAISRARLKTFGRAALRTVTALDEAPASRPLSPEASSSDLLTSRKILPGWAVRLFTGVLLLAPLFVAVDAFAALRRRREPVLVWLRWTLAGALPFALTALFTLVLGATNLLGAAPSAPVPPQALPTEPAALLAVALVFVLGWAWLRPTVLRIVGATGEPTEPGAAVVVVLVALGAAICVWIGNPYAAALFAPALHIWLFALAPEVRMRRVLRLVIVGLGFVPLVVVAVALERALGLGFVDAAWELALLVAGGHVSPLSALLWSLVAGCGAAALLIAARAPERADDEEIPITVRGPASYAGPGSLGGTESAIKR